MTTLTLPPLSTWSDDPAFTELRRHVATKYPTLTAQDKPYNHLDAEDRRVFGRCAVRVLRSWDDVGWRANW